MSQGYAGNSLTIHMSFTTLKGLLASTASKWSDANAPRLGAALAYYTLLSVAPLIVFVVAICGLIFKAQAEHQVLRQTAAVMGSGAASTLAVLLENAHHKATGILASVIALIALLFGASGVFMELRDALNTIWDAPRQPFGLKSMITQRLASFGMVLGLGVLLLLSLLVSAVFAVVQRYFTGFISLNTAIFGEVLNFVVSVAAIAILFALIFKFVPEVKLDWHDIAIGAVITSILFIIGKSLLALYLSTAAIGSTYGAAGSLVAFVVWVYYSAQIFLFGAAFTREYANRFGSRRTARGLGKKRGDSAIAARTRAAASSSDGR